MRRELPALLGPLRANRGPAAGGDPRAARAAPALL